MDGPFPDPEYFYKRKVPFREWKAEGPMKAVGSATVTTQAPIIVKIMSKKA